jgi:hypothetical protein
MTTNTQPTIPRTDAVMDVLEIHQIEFIDDETGWACGCDEDGVMHLPQRSDALRHQAEQILFRLETAQEGK